jgi:hypothetical protein
MFQAISPLWPSSSGPGPDGRRSETTRSLPRCPARGLPAEPSSTFPAALPMAMPRHVPAGRDVAGISLLAPGRLRGRGCDCVRAPGLASPRPWSSNHRERGEEPDMTKRGVARETPPRSSPCRRPLAARPYRPAFCGFSSPRGRPPWRRRRPALPCRSASGSAFVARAHGIRAIASRSSPRAFAHMVAVASSRRSWAMSVNQTNASMPSVAPIP